jgi:hypothetical protein
LGPLSRFILPCGVRTPSRPPHCANHPTTYSAATPLPHAISLLSLALSSIRIEQGSNSFFFVTPWSGSFGAEHPQPSTEPSPPHASLFTVGSTAVSESFAALKFVFPVGASNFLLLTSSSLMQENEKPKTDTQCWAGFDPKPHGNGLAQRLKWPDRANRWCGVCAPPGRSRSLGVSGGAATGGQLADKEAHRRWLRYWGASWSSPGNEKRTMGSPSSVSTTRWLGWQCAMAVAASGELWWSATTLAVLYSSRRMGSHLGVGQFGGKAGRGWNSPGKGKMTVKLWPILAIAAVIRRSDWSGGD